MSKYTTEVRFICETAAGADESKGYSDVSAIIEAAAPKVFAFDFPVFDENYRLPLEIKILRHYYTREISEETVGLWKLRLEDRLNMIMPYYNKLYSSELLQFNPLYDVDVTRNRTIENEGNEDTTSKLGETTNVTGSEATNTTEAGNRSQTAQSDSSSQNANTGTSTTNGTTQENGSNQNNVNRWDLYSDTPQGGIQIFGKELEPEDPTVQNNAYLTNARNISESNNGSNTASGSSSSEQSTSVNESGNESSNSSLNENTQNVVNGTRNTSSNETRDQDITGNRQITNTEQYTEQVMGKQGVNSYSRLLKEFRETFLNIDKMIIEELSDLFFGLW